MAAVQPGTGAGCGGLAGRDVGAAGIKHRGQPRQCMDADGERADRAQRAHRPHHQSRPPAGLQRRRRLPENLLDGERAESVVALVEGTRLDPDAPDGIDEATNAIG